jgi:hypothetical protein
MATTQLDICNRALQKVGGTKLANLAGTDVYTVALNRAWTDALEYELRTHNWNFAIRRTSLSAPYVTITGITAAEPPVVTYTGTVPSNGDRVYIENVVGMTEVNNNYYRIANVDTTPPPYTFELTDPDDNTNINGTGFTAWSSGGTATVCPYYGFTRKFAMPSDCLRIVELENFYGITHNLGGLGSSSDYTIESGYILCNDSGPIFIRYITNDFTNLIPVSAWDSMFKEAMACRIALEIQHEIKQNDDGYERIAREYSIAIRTAKLADAIQTPAEIMPESDWLLSRL